MRTGQPDFEEGTLNEYVVRPNEVQGGDRYGYKVVATVDTAVNQWRAYSGPTSWSDDKVARTGDPLTEAQAKVMFPALAMSGRKYRG